MSRKAGAHARTPQGNAMANGSIGLTGSTGPGSGPGIAAGTTGVRIGRLEARRLLAGRPARHMENFGLERLLAAAAAPEPRPPVAGRGLETVLVAFADVPGARRAGRTSIPVHRWPRALVIKCLAVLILLSGAGAAAADALPSPVQSLVYDMFGGLGFPAPTSSPPHHGHKSGPADPTASPTPGASQSTSPTAPGGTGATPTPTGSGSPTAQTPTALCELALRSLSTPGALNSGELAELSADAGGYLKISAYCARVLNISGGFTPPAHQYPPTAPVTTAPGEENHSPEPGKSATPTPTTHATHSPDPHQTVSYPYGGSDQG